MAINRYQMEVGNSNVGALNTALWDLHCDSAGGPGDAVIVAQMIALTVNMLPAAGTYVQGCRKEAVGAHGSIPLDFPADEYAALRAEDAGLPEMTNWAAAAGSGNMSALGTGATISEYSAVPGRSTTGRIYTMYLRESALATASGLVTNEAIGIIEAGYINYVFGAGDNSAAVNLQAVVYSPKLGTSQEIITPKVSVRPCRLKTRTR